MKKNKNKIKINIAKNAGFCGGVFRAFEMVKKEFGNSDNKRRVFLLGALVHNENVMKLVEGWGIRKIDSLERVRKNDIVIITAHGTGEKVLKSIEKKEANVFDATCPKVSLIHKKVREHSRKGEVVVILGDKDHKEVKGVGGWCDKKNLKIIRSFQEAEKFVQSDFFKKNKKKFLLVSQTTQNVEVFHKTSLLISEKARKAGIGFECLDTICRATANRQKEAKQIARENEGVIVVGGKNSANTQTLFGVAKSINPNSICIEDLNSESQQKLDEFRSGFSQIGILSGASTSFEDIEKIALYLKQN